MAELKIINKKLNASSTFEVTVATVLMALIFTISISIYLRVISTSYQSRQVRYKAYSTKILQESIQQHNLESNEWQVEDIIITKTVDAYQGNENLRQLTISVKDGPGKVISEIKALVYEPEKED